MHLVFNLRSFCLIFSMFIQCVFYISTPGRFLHESLIFYFRSRAGSVIGLACNLTSLLSILIHPFMPDVSAEIRKQLQVCIRL